MYIINSYANESAIVTSNTARRRDPEARRREILTAATELVVENGPAALTHRAVAERANVPLGSTTQHFSSIDELRETTLRALAGEVDTVLHQLEPAVAQIHTKPELLVAELRAFLTDRRAVRAELSLLTTAANDPRMQELALRWFTRFTDLLATRIGRDRALAIAVYVDGATVHAGLHEHPLSERALLATLQALTTEGAPE